MVYTGHVRWLIVWDWHNRSGGHLLVVEGNWMQVQRLLKLCTTVWPSNSVGAWSRRQWLVVEPPICGSLNVQPMQKLYVGLSATCLGLRSTELPLHHLLEATFATPTPFPTQVTFTFWCDFAIHNSFFGGIINKPFMTKIDQFALQLLCSSNHICGNIIVVGIFIYRKLFSSGSRIFVGAFILWGWNTATSGWEA